MRSHAAATDPPQHAPNTPSAPLSTSSAPSSVPSAPAYHYNVKMTCGGCSGAIERVLKKNVEAREWLGPQSLLTQLVSIEPTAVGVIRLADTQSLANSFTVSLPSQRVLVWGPTLPPFETITEKIAKTGKEILAKEVVEDQGKLAGLAA